MSKLRRFDRLTKDFSFLTLFEAYKYTEDAKSASNNTRALTARLELSQQELSRTVIPNPTGWAGEVWKRGDELAGKTDRLKVEVPITSFFQYQNSRFVDKGCMIRRYDASIDTGNNSVRHRFV